MKKAITLFATVLLLAGTCFSQNHILRTFEGKKIPAKHVKFNPLTTKHAAKSFGAKSLGDTITSFPWSESFEDTISGYTFIDYDSDGFNWFLAANEEYAHSGEKMVVSASFDQNEGDLTPDNWMILPTFVIPVDSTNMVLSWYEGAPSTYFSEYYSVYVDTTGRTVADFLATTPVFSNTTTGGWTKKVIDLSSYAGKTVNIAFRHHNVTGEYYLFIDDINLGNIEIPDLTLQGPRIVRAGDTVVYTALVNYPCTLTWSVSADYSLEENNTMTVVWNTAGTYSVIVTAANVSGSFSDTLTVEVVNCDPISTFPFVENFETNNPCWKTICADPNNPNEFGIEETGDAIEGNSMFKFSSWDRANDYNQYLITPELQIPTNVDFMLKFYYYTDYPGESFRVLASTTDDNIESFTQVLVDYEEAIGEEIQEVAFILPANAKYLCINYYSDYSYELYIDQLTIEPLTAPTVTLNGPAEIGTGNEATFIATSSLADSYAWTVDGNPVTETGSILTYTFTTATQHTVSVTTTNRIGTSEPATMTVDVFSCDGITLPYAPDFSEGLHCWTNISLETEGFGWLTSQEAFESDPIGQVVSMSAFYFWGMMFDETVDNWLKSPLIAMPTGGSYMISWEVLPFATEYPNDHYGVYVIEEDNEPVLLFEETLTSAITNFEQRTATIPASITGNFRIAFRHFDNPGDGYAMILDNIQIVETVGIDNVENNTVNIYPTPTSSTLNITGNGIRSIQMFDACGRKVMESATGGKYDISNFANGVYIVRVTTDNGISTKKVVKK